MKNKLLLLFCVVCAGNKLLLGACASASQESEILLKEEQVAPSPLLQLLGQLKLNKSLDNDPKAVFALLRQILRDKALAENCSNLMSSKLELSLNCLTSYAFRSGEQTRIHAGGSELKNLALRCYVIKNNDTITPERKQVAENLLRIITQHKLPQDLSLFMETLSTASPNGSPEMLSASAAAGGQGEQDKGSEKSKLEDAKPATSSWWPFSWRLFS